MLRSFVIAFFISVLVYSYASQTPRGARIRFTKKGMQYAAELGFEKLRSELYKQSIGDATGNNGGVDWAVRNIRIHYINIPTYSLLPAAGVGLQAAVSGISLKLSGRVSYTFKKGWVKIGDSTNVEIKASGVSLALQVQIDARNGRPVATAPSCSSGISSIDLDFSGGASWVYNLFSGILEGKMRDELKKLICKEGTKLVNENADRMLSSFPVTKPIDNVSQINYEFEKPEATNDYFDLVLRGEFQSRAQPQSSTLPPPAMDLSNAGDKMFSVWLSDFTLNTAGQVYHDANFLNRVITSTDKMIPDSIAPYLNTDSFRKVIPQLPDQFPNAPIQFRVGSYKPPTIRISPNAVQLELFATVRIEVQKTDGSVVPVFFVNLDIGATGSVGVNSETKITGKITDFTFSANVGGSIIGNFLLPLDSPALRSMVKGLIVDSANPKLEEGFPLPKLNDLELVNPTVTFVTNAIRIDTDVKYHG